MENENDNNNNTEFKGVIFDLDGTILDSIGIWKKIDKDFFKSKEMFVPQNFEREISGMNLDQIAKYTKEKFNFQDSIEDLVKQWRKLARTYYSRKVKLKLGAKEYLEYLKQNNMKIGVATACDENLYKVCLKNNKILDYIDVIVNCNEVDSGKDNPKIYLECVNRLGLKPENVVVFEDIMIAIKAVKSAGMVVFAVYDENSTENFEEIVKESGDYVTDFRELIGVDLLEEIKKKRRC